MSKHGNSADPLEDEQIERIKQESKNYRDPECFILGAGFARSLPILYGVQEDEDYAGGGVSAIFSTFEKAMAFVKTMRKPGAVDSIAIVTMKIDDPNFEGEQLYYKHG